MSTQPTTPWAGFKYQPVPGLMNRHIARFLRRERKRMRRNFLERGFVDLYLQLEEIRRDSTQGFMQKNRRFQRVMNEYIASVSKHAAPANLEDPVGAVGVPAVLEPAVVPVRQGNGSGRQPDGGVYGLASADAADSVVVVEE
jgi:hypothetical protein